jgi:glycosyltransferase involved in cell wall biosynthesis
MRALFVNSGMLGHRAVAGLFKNAVGMIPALEAVHIDLSGDLTLGDRALRRMFSLRLTPRSGPVANLDLRRWREELNVGLLAARRIASAEHRQPFDVLHFHTQATAYASFARMRATPSIVSIDATQHLASHEAASRMGRLSYLPNIVHDRYVFRAASAITATSDWAARDLAAHYPECADKLHVMPYPVCSAFDRSWIEERYARATSARVEPVRVLFMGGDFPRKGGDDLLAAWQAGGFPDAALTLVTDWPVAHDQLPPGVTVIGGVTPDTPRWTELWRNADLFVMPTRHEAFGVVFQEAAAAGVPVVGTSINAVPEIVVDGHTGLLITPGDQDALVRALRTLVSSPHLRRRMGTAAAARIQAVSAPEIYASKLESLLADLVQRHERQRT